MYDLGSLNFYPVIEGSEDEDECNMGWSRKSEHSVIENVMVHISAATRNMAAWSNSMNENITGYSCPWETFWLILEYLCLTYK